MAAIPNSLNYQIELLEKSQKEGLDLSDDRIHKVFSLLSDLIPLMGVHRRLFQIIYSELFKAVFSDELTVGENKPSETAAHAVPVQKTAYFTLYRNVIRTRDEKAESLESYVGSLQDSLAEKESTLEQLREEIVQLNTLAESLNSDKMDLERKVVDLSNTIEKLDSSFKEFVAQKDVSDLHYEDEILNLQNELSSTSTEVDRVEKFEKLFKDLDHDFTADEMQVNKMPAQIVPASNKNSVLVDLKSCQALERQLLSVQNSLIEEFDLYMEGYRERLESVTLAKNYRDANFDKDEKMLTEIDIELAEKQKVFKRTIQDVEDELEMLRIHRENLEVNRDRIKQEEEEKARDLGATKQDKKATGAKNLPPKAGAAAGQEEKEGEMSAAQKAAMETVFDKLDAQEQMTSKYSSIIYFSNNRGKTFYELPQNSLCNSCGTTTMICPHKIAKQDWVVELPPNTQLLRISRPKLKLQKKLDDREIEALFSKQLKQAEAAHSKTTTKTVDNRGQEESKEDQAKEDADQIEGQSQPEDEAKSRASAMSGSQAEKQTADIEELRDDALYFSRIKDIQEGLLPITQKLEAQFEVIWKEFRRRTGGSLRLIPRHISEERVVSLVEQFLASVLWQDRSVDTENVPSVVESMYIFFRDRFLLEKMAHFTMFDFLNSLQYFAKNNIVLLTFVQCMTGDMDFSRLRSLLYLGQLVKSIDWTSLDDLYWLLHVAFEFLPSEECDSFVLDYVSFSKNSLSAELVMHFLFYIFLKQKDPRISHSEIRLCQFPSSEPGFMSETEFAIALNDLIHMHSVTLRSRLFHQAYKAVLAKQHPTGAPDGKAKENKVPFETLVAITAYLELLDVFETAKKKFSTGDRSQRQSEYPKGLKIKVIPNKNPIISADSLLKMAANFSQRERSRLMRNMQASLEKAAGN